MILENPIAELSAALDEIYRLRRALAFEADVLRDRLALRSLSDKQRGITTLQIERMTQAACGHTPSAYANVSSDALHDSMIAAGASPTLTRWEFAQERAKTDG